MLSTIVLFISLLHGAYSTAPSWKTKTVQCQAGGFIPTFTWQLGTTTTTQKIQIDLELGGSSDAWCNAQKPGTLSDVNADTTFTKADFSNLYTGATIPYKQGNNGEIDGTAAIRCGGKFEHYTDGGTEKIKYEVDLKATVTRRHRNKVDRKTKYAFVIRCSLTRETTKSADQGFTVATALVEETSEDVTADISAFSADLKLYTDQNYGTAITQQNTYNNKDTIYAKITQGADQGYFKYVVESCLATVGSDPQVSEDAKKDTFLNSQCPLDSTVNIVAYSNGEFKMNMKSFSFDGQSGAIYLHCTLKVCLSDSSDAACTQQTSTQCAASNTAVDRRRRREARRQRRQSVEDDGLEGVIGTRTVSSTTSILFDRSEVFAPRCGNAFIYDRVLQECSNENLLEIRGVYLGGATWDPAYANVTSEAFKSMAAAREYQLWVLLQVTQRSAHIHGVKVIRARQGSVILDVVVKYSASLSAEEAFNQFEGALHTKPSVTRVMNLLQIRQPSTIEFVPVLAATPEADTEKLILIVVVVVLFVVVFIAGVTLFKVRQVRQRSSNNAPTATATGFDNKGIDA